VFSNIFYVGVATSVASILMASVLLAQMAPPPSSSSEAPNHGANSKPTQGSDEN
jgi:hypothetical protein